MSRVIIFLFLILFSPFKIHAAGMTSPEYQLEIEEITASEEATLRSTRPEIALKLRENGHVILAVDPEPASLKISGGVITLDRMPVEHKVYISTNSRAPLSYQTTILLKKELSSSPNNIIDSAFCNLKTLKCKKSISLANPNISTPGWGIHILGSGRVNKYTNDRYATPLHQREILVREAHVKGESASVLEIVGNKIDSTEGIYTGSMIVSLIPTY